MLLPNGSRPACDIMQNGPRIDLLASKIDPSHTPTSEINQELTDRQELWLTRRFLISPALAAAIAVLVWEVRK